MTGHFGFEGSCQCVFAEGPFYDAFQNMGDPANFGILEGIMMNFVVQRRGNDYTISVNGKTVQTHTQAIPITSIGLRPHRATFKLYEWSVTIDTDDCALPSVGGDTYTNTDGYCRGGPAWEAPHNGAGDLWDCSPTGGMDGVNADGALVIECQAACDADDLCGAFDIEAHSTTTGTRSECCLFREGHTGQGSTGRHCYVRDDGAPVNRVGGGGGGGCNGADLDGSGSVNVSDLLQLLAGFDDCCDGDVNGDGATNVSDLLLLLSEFDNSC